MYRSAGTLGLRVANSSVISRQATKYLKSDTSCPVAFQNNTDGKHQSFGQGAEKLCCQSDFARISFVIAEMVGAESVNLECQVFSESRSRTGNSDHFRRQSLGMGCGMSWSDNPRPLVSDRDVAAHQCAGIEGSRVSSEILQGPVGGQSCSFMIGQHDSCLKDFENGVAAVRKVSGVTKEIWEFVLLHGSMITAHHIPGKQHNRGLGESDLQRQQQLETVSTCLQSLQKMFPWTKWIYLQINWITRSQDFGVGRPDTLAEGVDTLTMVSRGMRAYAFTPFKLIHRVLRKVHSEGATLLLVAPVWCQQPWYPMLLRVLIEQPVLIPSSHLLLTAPDGAPHPMCLNQRLVLAAWLVSGDRETVLNFLQTQEIWSPKLGVQVPLEPINQAGRNYIAGVVNHRQILFRACGTCS